jgi:hypothetical protein
VHVIDAAAGDPAERFETIDGELAAYGAGLDRLPQVVVLNKIDLLPERPGFAPEDDRVLRVFALSAATGEGVEAFKRALFELVPPLPEAPPDDSGLVDFLVYRPRPRGRPAYRILRTETGFRVAGDAPPPEELEAALAAAGARPGHVVEVGEETFEFT